MTADPNDRSTSQSAPKQVQKSRIPIWEAPILSGPVGLSAFWLLVALLVLVRCRVGLYGINYVSHDAFMVLDGAWRMLYHQRPHADFNSMVGPVAYLPTMIGLRLSHHTVQGMAYGQALLGLFVAGWTFLLGRRLPDVPRALFSLCTLAYVISPAQLGISPFFLTPGMSYNRAAYGLLAVVLLECCVGQRRLHFLGGASTGVALVALSFLKFTSILPSVLLLLVLIPLKPQTRQRWAGIATGALLTLLIAAIYYHFHFGLVAADILLTLGAKHVHITTLYSYDAILLEAALGIVVAASAASLLIAKGDPGEGRRLLLGGVAVAAVSVLVILSNWQQAELPLLTLYLLIVMSRLPREDAPESSARFRRLATGASILVYASVPLLSLCASLGTGMYSRHVRAKRVPLFQARTLQPFVCIENERDYTTFVNNGLALVRANIRPGERVMSLDFTNPFSIGLELPPAPGGSTNLQYGGSFDERHHVAPEKLFGGAELVAFSLLPSDPTLLDKVPTIYGPYLQAHFHRVAESQGWQLYRRNR